MRLFLSLEDKLAAINDDIQNSSYRKEVVAFLESQVGNEHTIMSEEGQIGWTKSEGDGVTLADVTLATGTSNEIRLTTKSTNKSNTPEPLVPGWKADLCPVLVIDSDGVDPVFILDYIEEVTSKKRPIIHDSIYMGHLYQFLRYIAPTAAKGTNTRYSGIFGIIVQHPNLEGGEFSGYRSTMTDNQRQVGARHTNMAFIEKMGPRKKKYGQQSKRIDIDHFVNSGFLLEGVDSQLFSIMEEEQAIFSRDPEIWVQHVNSYRGWKTEMSSSCYLSKKDRKQGSANNRQMRSLWAPSAWDSGRLDFKFRMFDSREQN